jgi:hypothetical protein
VSDPTIYAPRIEIQTGYQDWVGCPPHLFGLFIGRPLNTWGFADVYAQSGKVIVRADLFEGTVGVPYSFVTHNPGQVISRFVTNSNYTQAVARGVGYNAIMNPVMQGATGASEFIHGRVGYTIWRLRGLDEGGNGHVFVGGGIGNNGVSLTGMYVVGPPPLTYVLSADFTVGATSGNCQWQLEVGFGSTENALATAHDVAATPEWPAFG